MKEVFEAYDMVAAGQVEVCDLLEAGLELPSHQVGDVLDRAAFMEALLRGTATCPAEAFEEGIESLLEAAQEMRLFFSSDMEDDDLVHEVQI